MKFDYLTLLSPIPIKLSIGTLKKPTLKEISEITYDRFSYYKVFLEITPEQFYTKMKDENGIKYWNNLSPTQKDQITMYDILLQDEIVFQSFYEIFCFFFEEKVIFNDETFCLCEKAEKSQKDYNIIGVINVNNFQDVLNCIKQVCYIYTEKDNEDDLKFKNKLAKQLYERMKKAEQEEMKKKKADINYSLPNLISAVATRHPSLNLINIWDLTIFQLHDAFNRLQGNEVFNIDCHRVSVWGDEKKKFDITAWYKNLYDKK